MSSLTDPCIICGKREGKVRTKDGPACEGCIPPELVHKAASLGKSSIIVYSRTHGIRPQAPVAEPRKTLAEPARSRSRAMTPGAGITLSEALNDAIAGSDGIDMVVSFIRKSGLNLLIDSLREAAESGKRIRTITSAYMGATEYEAVAELADLPNSEVRMELDPGDRPLHAKSYLFRSENGKGTAFVGSANMSETALTDGEEWVAMIREEDLPAMMADLRAEFERLWTSSRLETVTRRDRARIERAIARYGK